MLEGTGRLYGFFSVESISETDTVHLRNGTPQKIEFSVSLIRTDEKTLDMASVTTAAALAGITGAAASPLSRARSAVGGLL